jgi:hypothetical protein
MLNMEWVVGDYRTDHSTSILSIAWWNIEHEQEQKSTQIRASRYNLERSRGPVSYLHLCDAFVSTCDTLIRLVFPNPTPSSGGVPFPS